MTEPPIAVDHLDHHYGRGELRRQVLFDVSTTIRRGEIVILTGPSGSGKTTLLALIGALRSVQAGSVRILGRELLGASEAERVRVRRRIGYVFQAHNLLDALTAGQNVRMAVELDASLPPDQVTSLVLGALASVGLADRMDARPGELSGGQRQRVAIARALAHRPAIVLADEPTASLDRQTGRSIVELLERLARREGVTVVIVTHDHRILDVADRILTLEDGRLASPLAAVAIDGRAKLRLLAQDVRRGDLVERMQGLDLHGFRELLAQLGDETRRLLEVADLIQGETFESVLEQVLHALAAQLAAALSASQATVYLVERGTGDLWWFAPGPEGRRELRRAPPDRHLPARVAREGRSLLAGASAESPDSEESRLATPVADAHGRTFAVVELARDRAAPPFEPADADRLSDTSGSLGALLETWWRMSCTCRSSGLGSSCPHCGAAWQAELGRPPAEAARE
jgi:putative ABC transport system ATP-binding protein